MILYDEGVERLVPSGAPVDELAPRHLNEQRAACHAARQRVDAQPARDCGDTHEAKGGTQHGAAHVACAEGVAADVSSRKVGGRSWKVNGSSWKVSRRSWKLTRGDGIALQELLEVLLADDEQLEVRARHLSETVRGRKRSWEVGDEIMGAHGRSRARAGGDQRESRRILWRDQVAITSVETRRPPRRQEWPSTPSIAHVACTAPISSALASPSERETARFSEEARRGEVLMTTSRSGERRRSSEPLGPEKTSTSP